MEDFDIFALSLETYLENEKKYSGEELHNKYVEFQESIKNLKCNDFRFYYYRAHYLNGQDKMDEAKCNIDNAITLTYSINNEFPCTTWENCVILWCPDMHKKRRYPLKWPLHRDSRELAETNLTI